MLNINLVSAFKDIHLIVLLYERISYIQFFRIIHIFLMLIELIHLSSDKPSFGADRPLALALLSASFRVPPERAKSIKCRNTVF